MRWMLPSLVVLLVASSVPDLPTVVRESAEACLEDGHGSSGRPFTRCVEKRLQTESPETLSVELTNWRIDPRFGELIRNFSCSHDDAGTPAVRIARLSMQVGGYTAGDLETPWGREDAPNAGANSQVASNYVHLEGFLPQGHDIGLDSQITAAEAAKRCDSMQKCKGFTMGVDSPGMPGDVWYKSTTKGYGQGEGWQTYKRKARKLPQEPVDANTCTANADVATKEILVDIVRETPLVAILRNFSSAEECSKLMAVAGEWDSMERAYVDSGGYSDYRRSYSASIEPDLEDTEDDVTQFTARMFAVTRNLTGYKVYPPGQEPINAVLYKEIGDEYRPHCDGDCHRKKYELGDRVATSILYCHVPDAGGATSFTRDTLKIVPRSGDMLLFSYYLADGRMSGMEAEHSGCPLRAGKKWIGTQWYREGVHTEWNYEVAAGWDQD